LLDDDERTIKSGGLLFLLGLQVFGAIVFILQELPEFRQVVLAPGQQLRGHSLRSWDRSLFFLGCKLPSGSGYCVPQFQHSARTLCCLTFFFFWGASVSFSAALYSQSSFSGKFQN
jgi:hypothetical protein